MSGVRRRPTSLLNLPGCDQLRSLHTTVRGDSIVLNPTFYATGSGPPPAVTLVGAQKRLVDLRLEITTGGARSATVFRWAEDGGASGSWTSGVSANSGSPAGTVPLGTTGVSAAFPLGTYNTDNVYVSKVVQWNDVSLRGRHYENALATDGTNLPRLVRNPTTGRWALRFFKANGTYLRIASSAYCTELIGGNDTPVTILTVAAIHGAVGSQHFIHSITNTTLSTSELSLLAHSDSKWGVSKRGSSGAESFTPGTHSGGTVDNTAVHRFEHVHFGQSVALWDNGVQAVGTGGAGVAQDVPSLTVTEAFLGGIRSGANIYGDVDVYGQAAYAGALDANTRAILRQWLQYNPQGLY